MLRSGSNRLNGHKAHPDRRPIPAAHRAGFKHLYLEVAAFGILNGSAITFISVYLTRIGADAFEIGLLTAGPAAVALLLALPAGWWLRRRRLGLAVFWSSVATRFFYLIWALLPSFLPMQSQRLAFITVTFIMSVPGTALAVGFNALFGDAVPPDWRGHVTGVRNALLALTTVVASLLCGRILTWLPQPVSYQVVFAIGCLGAAVSSFQLWFVRPVPVDIPGISAEKSMGDLSQPGLLRPAGEATRHGVGLRFLTRSQSLRIPRVDALTGPFGKVLLGLLVFHLAQYISAPLVPVYWVQQIHLSDSAISVGNALLYGCVFLGSTQLARISRKLGHHKVTVLGAALLCLFPGLTAITRDVTLFFVTAASGGLAWSLVTGALPNYVLERAPDTDRPTYLAWYNVVLNAAVVVGSVVGPFLASRLGLSGALLFSAAARLLSAVVIWRWG